VHLPKALSPADLTHVTYDSCSAVQANHTAQCTLDPPSLPEPLASLNDTAFQVWSCIASSTNPLPVTHLLARTWVWKGTLTDPNEMFAHESQGHRNTAAPVTRHLPLLVSTQQAKPGPSDSEGTVPVTVTHVFWMHTPSNMLRNSGCCIVSWLETFACFIVAKKLASCCLPPC